MNLQSFMTEAKAIAAELKLPILQVVYELRKCVQVIETEAA